LSAPRPIALITGASSGIGWALTWVFAAHGHELMLVARREDRLAALADEIAASGKPRPTVLSVDLDRRDAVQVIRQALADNGLAVQYLVNSAGFGLAGDIDKIGRAEQLALVDLNIRALTDLSLAFLDDLERYRGGILNLSSVAGFLPGPGMTVYYASKAYVLSFSEAMRHELRNRGVRVTVLCPGPVRTEFQERAGVAFDPITRRLSRSVERVAAEGYRGLMEGRRRVVPGFHNKLATKLIPLLPRRLLFAFTDLRERSRVPSSPADSS
jgi:uncharacterized protein